MIYSPEERQVAQLNGEQNPVNIFSSWHLLSNEQRTHIHYMAETISRGDDSGSEYDTSHNCSFAGVAAVKQHLSARRKKRRRRKRSTNLLDSLNLLAYSEIHAQTVSNINTLEREVDETLLHIEQIAPALPEEQIPFIRDIYEQLLHAQKRIDVYRNALSENERPDMKKLIHVGERLVRRMQKVKGLRDRFFAGLPATPPDWSFLPSASPA